MSCIFLDDFGYYSTAELPAVYSSVDSTFATYSILPTGGPFTDGCVQRVSTSSGSLCGYLQISPGFVQTGAWTQQAYGYLGSYFYIEDLAKSQGGFSNVLLQTGTFLTVLNGSLANFCITLNSNGTFTLNRVGSALATSLAALANATWAYVEVGWYLSQGSDGWVIIKVNGNIVLSFTGRTSPQAGDMFPFQPPPPFYTSIRYAGMSSDSGSPLLNVRYSSLYFFDGVASADPSNPVNTFLGPKQIKHILTDAPGDLANWSPLAPPNWSEVNAVPPVGDAAYVETAGTGTRDAYNYQNVIGNPVAIMVASYLRKTTSAAGNWSNSFRQAGVDYTSPVQGLGGTSYTYLKAPYDTNPATSRRYTESEMNAGQWGPLS